MHTFECIQIGSHMMNTNKKVHILFKFLEIRLKILICPLWIHHTMVSCVMFNLFKQHIMYTLYMHAWVITGHSLWYFWTTRARTKLMPMAYLAIKHRHRCIISILSLLHFTSYTIRGGTGFGRKLKWQGNILFPP